MVDDHIHLLGIVTVARKGLSELVPKQGDLVLLLIALDETADEGVEVEVGEEGLDYGRRANQVKGKVTLSGK